MNIKNLYNLYLGTQSVSTDTRKIHPDDMYIALKGPNFNGNRFAMKAIEAGAACAIVDEEEFEDTENQIFFVENSLIALQELAKYHREQLKIPIFGLTGSNGKTTTKELITAVLQKKYNVSATKGNLNNHIGVPLTILGIKANHEFGIVEMGANHQKEIEFLCSISQPDYGYITNFGKAHLEGFGGVEGVIKGKSELYTYLRKNKKTAFINSDDEKQKELTKGIKTISFGTQKEVDFQLKFNENKNGKCPAIQYNSTSIQSQLTGSYNAPNVAIAVTAGLYFGVDLEDIKEAIENYEADNNRSQTLIKEDRTFILDAYNANPSSMSAALYNFARMDGKKAAILGDMFELGEFSETEHQKIVDLVLKLRIPEIYLIGEHFSDLNIRDESIKNFKTRELAASYFKTHNLKGRIILIKGSRGMALENLLEVL